MILEPDTDWMQDARCRGVHAPDLFFPAPYDSKAIAEAKAVCAECPVRTECLNYALDTRQADGIFGGLTWSERRKGGIRSRRRAERGEAPLPTHGSRTSYLNGCRCFTCKAANARYVREYRAEHSNGSA